MSFNELVLKKYSQTKKHVLFEELQKECLNNFTDLGIPKSKDEKWKYINVSSFLKKELSFNLSSNKKLKKNKETNKIVFYNGKLQKGLSSVQNKNILFFEFNDAVKKQEKILRKIINYNKSNYDSTCFLNTAFLNESFLLIIVKENTKINETLEILHLYDSENEAICNQRKIFYVNKNCEINIVEKTENIGKKYIFCNSMNEFLCDSRSFVNYYKTQDSENMSIIDNSFINIKKESSFSNHTYSFKGDLIRNNIYADLTEENSNVNLYGISFLKNKSIVDNYTYIKHLVPNCFSNELYKGMYDEHSRGVFCGKILVEKDAQKTNAFQQNNNILLSDNSRIDSKPQLEIYADDVSCSHGCTIGQMDENAIFYLKSRGITEKEAIKIINLGFIYDVINNCKLESLKQYIKNRVLK